MLSTGSRHSISQLHGHGPSKVMSDILRALDNGNIALLTLLDLSAAFDTVDHAILLKRLEVSYGLDGHSLGCSCPI